MAANFGQKEQTIHGPSGPSAIAVRLQPLLKLLHSLQVQVAATAQPVNFTRQTVCKDLRAAGLSQCR